MLRPQTLRKYQEFAVVCICLTIFRLPESKRVVIAIDRALRRMQNRSWHVNGTLTWSFELL